MGRGLPGLRTSLRRGAGLGKSLVLHLQGVCLEGSETGRVAMRLEQAGRARSPRDLKATLRSRCPLTGSKGVWLCAGTAHSETCSRE